MVPEIIQTISDVYFNKEITLRGLAVNSKAGACIKLDEDIVFVDGKHDWEDDFFNQTILVTGTLVDKKIIPDVFVDEDGAISQGAPGSQLVLEQVKEIKLA